MSHNKEVQTATRAAETVLLCHHWISPLHFNNCLVQLSYQIWPQKTERIIGTTLPTLQELYLSRVSKRAGKITLDPHIQHTSSLNCYRLVNATELWAPERPDTETVSSLKQSISWTLDIKRGTHNTIILFLNTYLLHFKFAPNIPVHTNCLFVYCSFVVCVCPGAVILLHRGATVTKTNSSYV